MNTQSSTIVQRDDGIPYGDYVERRLSVARSAFAGSLSYLSCKRAQPFGA